jgi:hypothetical protein
MRPRSRLTRRLCAAAFAALAAYALASRALAQSDAAVPVGRDLSLADRALWRKTLRWDDECEKGYAGPDDRLGGLVFQAISAKVYLAEVTCALGAYQSVYRLFVLDETVAPAAVRPLEFEQLEDSGVTGPHRFELDKQAELDGEIKFDARRGVLTALNKFRGPGDCGVLADYAISPQGSRLIRVRAKPECDGKGPFDPEKWKPFAFEKLRK